MLKAIQVWQRLNQMGINKTLTEIENALNQVDQQVIAEQEKQRYRVEIWDKQTPINGVPAEKILQRDDIPQDGEIYLIYVDGNLQYLQPHDPFQAGIVALTKDNVLDIANRHIEQLIQPRVDEKVFEAVLEKLLE